MSFEAAIAVSALILFVTIIMVLGLIASRRVAARNEEMKQQASMRGWSFESAREKGFWIKRWKGSSDGIEWIAESRHKPGGHGHSPVRRSRWLATAVRGPEKPILCMGVSIGKEVPTVKLAQGDGFIANLAKKAAGFAFDKAVDAYFGEEIGTGVDARELKPVPGTTVPGYTIMAADIDAASRILFQGLTRALTASPPPEQKHEGYVHVANKMPWVLLWKGGIAVGKAELIDSIDEVERLAHLGATVARVPIS